VGSLSHGAIEVTSLRGGGGGERGGGGGGGKKKGKNFCNVH